MSLTDDDFPNLAPRPVDMVHDLHTALHGESWARPESPAKVWAALLAEVRASRERERGLRDENAKDRRDLFETGIEWQKRARTLEEGIKAHRDTIVVDTRYDRDLYALLDDTETDQ